MSKGEQRDNSARTSQGTSTRPRPPLRTGMLLCIPNCEQVSPQRQQPGRSVSKPEGSPASCATPCSGPSTCPSLTGWQRRPQGPKRHSRREVQSYSICLQRQTSKAESARMCLKSSRRRIQFSYTSSSTQTPGECLPDTKRSYFSIGAILKKNGSDAVSVSSCWNIPRSYDAKQFRIGVETQGKSKLLFNGDP